MTIILTNLVFMGSFVDFILVYTVGDDMLLALATADFTFHEPQRP